jgi:hypothetical protein
MANKYTKKCSTSLVIEEMQIKTTLRFQLTPVKMAIIKKTNEGRRHSIGGRAPASLAQSPEFQFQC